LKLSSLKRGSVNVRAHGFGGPRREQSPEIGMHTRACFLNPRERL
jgi:hypothetical protein